MAKNETGIAITIKAWLPTGKGLDEQFAALSLVKQAHSTGDYAPLLAAAKIEAVGTDSKTRRVEDSPPAAPAERMDTDVKDRLDDAFASAVFPDPTPEPAATDDALAERPALDDPDGVVVEPAAEEVAEPKRKAKAA